MSKIHYVTHFDNSHPPTDAVISSFLKEKKSFPAHLYPALVTGPLCPAKELSSRESTMVSSPLSLQTLLSTRPTPPQEQPYLVTKDPKLHEDSGHFCVASCFPDQSAAFDTVGDPQLRVHIHFASRTILSLSCSTEQSPLSHCPPASNLETLRGHLDFFFIPRNTQ